jgi:hypothetical protein
VIELNLSLCCGLIELGSGHDSFIVNSNWFYTSNLNGLQNNDLKIVKFDIFTTDYFHRGYDHIDLFFFVHGRLHEGSVLVIV